MDAESPEAYLTGYSRRFLSYLAREAPDLHGTAKPALDRDKKPTGFLLAEVTSPNVKVASPLWLTTEDDEVTVGFDATHAHFGSWDETAPEEDSFAEAIALVREIQSDQLLVASWWLGERWCGSQFTKAESDLKRSIHIANTAALRVRSWSGTKDREEPGTTAEA